MKINKTDYELILALQKDGSQTYSDLADNLGITSKTVAKRVERLLSEKIISIRAQPNPYKLGLSASAMITIKADPSKIEPICCKLVENFYVNLVLTIFGRVDILAIAYFPNLDMLHDFINSTIYLIEGVSQVELYFINKIYKRYERFFIEETFNNEQPKIKSIDWELIKALARNARTSPYTLAQETGMHVSTVYRRIENLLSRGLIKISAVPNPSRLVRYSANAFITLDIEPSYVDYICMTLLNFPEVHFMMTLNNRSGVIVCIHARDNEDLYHFIKENVSHQKGLINTETFIRAMVKKSYYGWWMEMPEF